ncbi:MAG: DedA family protein [Cryobacterium sp.]|nr:DedA family protein [Oligoflexia bacterium]
MPVWIHDALSAANPYFYPMIFCALYFAGLGAPISADFVLLTVGYVAYQGQASYGVLIPLSIVGILSSDVTMYWIARHFGRTLAERWPLSKIITPAKLEKAEWKFSNQGYRVVFLARFMPGIRTVFMFTSGLLRLDFKKFLLADALGAFIVIPVILFSVKWVAGNVEALHAHIAQGQWMILGAALVAIAVTVLIRKSRKVIK